MPIEKSFIFKPYTLKNVIGTDLGKKKYILGGGSRQVSVANAEVNEKPISAKILQVLFFSGGRGVS